MLNNSIKNKVTKTPRSTAVAKILGLHKLLLPCFLAFAKSKKIINKKSSFLNHAVVNNNSKIKMESRIIRLFKVGFNITNLRNHKSQITKNKVVSYVLHEIIA